MTGRDDMSADAPRSAEARGYWRVVTRLVGVLFFAWAGVSYGLVVLLAGPLDGLRIGDQPFPRWFALNGAAVLYVALMIVFCVALSRIERSGQTEDGSEPPRSG